MERGSWLGALSMDGGDPPATADSFLPPANAARVPGLCDTIFNFVDS
jgi:hypothetical protein